MSKVEIPTDRLNEIVRLAAVAVSHDMFGMSTVPIVRRAIGDALAAAGDAIRASSEVALTQAERRLVNDLNEIQARFVSLDGSQTVAADHRMVRQHDEFRALVVRQIDMVMARVGQRSYRNGGGR